MAKQNDHGLIFEGDVKVRNLNQKGSGFIDIGNTTALTTQTSVETKERVSKQKGTYGSALDSLFQHTAARRRPSSPPKSV